MWGSQQRHWLKNTLKGGHILQFHEQRIWLWNVSEITSVDHHCHQFVYLSIIFLVSFFFFYLLLSFRCQQHTALFANWPIWNGYIERITPSTSSCGTPNSTLHFLPPHGCIHSQSTSVVADALCCETDRGMLSIFACPQYKLNQQTLLPCSITKEVLLSAFYVISS